MLRAGPSAPIRTMMRVPFVTSLLLLAAALSAQGKDAKAAATAVDFEKQIWPILESRCVDCHMTEHVAEGGRKKRPKGGVTLDSKDGIVAGNKKGKLVVAKKPDDSLLYQAVTLPADHEDHMPPQKAKNNTPLAKDQTDLIKTWIEQGASFGKWVGKKADAKAKDKDKDKAGDAPAGDGKEKPADKPKDHEKPGSEKSNPDKPSSDKPSSDKPSSDKPVPHEPGSGKPDPKKD
jgi:hypothetical protein